MRISAIVLGFGAEPTLGRCITDLRASVHVDLEIVLVDNGIAPGVLTTIADEPGVTILGPPTNRGFAGGCNAGVEASTGELIALVNSDAFVAPDALARLAAVAQRSEVGIASAGLRLDAEPELMNSIGNPVHFSCLTWAGGYREPASAHTGERSVASATGAAMVLTRQLWDELQGFDERYFCYVEDTELSLRVRQRGLDIRFVPDAVVRHRYEFSRNSGKFELLERNRLLTVLTHYELRTLLILAPVLVLFELAMLAQAASGGWLRGKLRGWRWLVANVAHVKRRRSWIQSARTTPDRVIAAVLSGRIEATNVDSPPGLAAFNAVLGCYWALARRLL